MFTIQDIINSLNQLEVKGKRNLDILLGVILALEHVQEANEGTKEETIKIDSGEEKVEEDG